MSDDPDSTASLRRSKRNKFHLDVAAIHHGRSRSPAIQQHVPLSQPGPSIIKASPRDSPIVFPKEEPISTSDEPPMIIVPKKINPKKAMFVPRGETGTPESLGKRKRKAAVFDDFSYSVDSEDDAEHVTPIGIEYVAGNSPGIKVGLNHARRMSKDLPFLVGE